MTAKAEDRLVQIVADENIPLLEQFFSEFGEIRKVAGRTMTREDVKDADILLVRSVTKVDEALIANSSVKFIGTCTIGTDHIDLAYLESLNQQRAKPIISKKSLFQVRLAAMLRRWLITF